MSAAKHHPQSRAHSSPRVTAKARWIRATPLLVACATLLVMVTTLWADGAYYTGGHFTYALDDAYIHMAIAKNLALHGVLGATPFEFTSASSSPLWTCLLALAFKVVGVRDIVPLVLTTIASLGLLVVSDFVMERMGVKAIPRLVALLWVCAATPLITIIYGGMEHPLQILLDVAFVYVSACLIGRREIRWDRMTYAALALAAAATSVRYEGVVLVAVVALALALRRRLVHAVSLAAAGAAPIVTYGLVAVSQGAYFLPNSVLVKSHDNLADLLLRLDFNGYGQLLARNLVHYQPYLLLASVCVLLVLQLRGGTNVWSREVLFPVISAAAAFPHLMLGQVGWFYRYEDYLMVLLGISLAVQLTQLGGVAWEHRESSVPVLSVLALVAVLALGSGASRGWSTWLATPRAMENVYEQMYQTAHFLKDNPQYDSVAIGDLGAVAYYNDNLRILDLEGLAETGEPLSTIGRHNSTAVDIARRAKKDGCKIAIVFPGYFDLPPEWVEVARWTISNNIVAYSDTVAFLAIPPTDPTELAEAVRAYSVNKLPHTVAAKGLPVPADK